MQDASKSQHNASTSQARNSDETRVDSPWKVGAHVSAVGGVENTVLNAVSIG